MDSPMVILRVLHIVGGVFWVGSVLVTVLFLFKVVGDMGPSGGQFMAALVKRHYLDAVPVSALIAVLSGVELLRRSSGGFDAAWMGSATGITISIGALAAILGLVLGLFVGRSSTLKAVALMGRAMQLPDGQEKATLVGQAAPLRARGMSALRVTAVLLVIATVCMSAARYV